MHIIMPKSSLINIVIAEVIGYQKDLEIENNHDQSKEICNRNDSLVLNKHEISFASISDHDTIHYLDEHQPNYISDR